MMTWANVRSGIFGIALAGFGCCWLTAQQSAPPAKNQDTTSDAVPGVVFKETTRRVLMDVVVTDKDGNPVHGLKKDDFAVAEDGTKQHILSFEVTDGDKPDFVPPKLPEMPVDTFVNLPPEPERGPLYILLYDMVNTDLDEQGTTFGPLFKFIDSKPAGTRFALYVNTDKLHLVQGFTSDRALLHAALTRKGPGPHMPERFLLANNFGQNDPVATLSIFGFLADYYAGIPGRKNLIWLSSHLTVTLDADPAHEMDSDPDGVKKALEKMMKSQIAVYPVNVSGVIVTESTTGGGSAGGGFSMTTQDRMNAEGIASYSGGHSYYGSNDLRTVLEEATQHGESYYSLSYAPTNEKHSYSARHVTVRLPDPGYRLDYRKTYFALPEGAAEPKKKADTPDTRFTAAVQNDNLYADIEHGGPMLHDLLFRAHLGVAGEPALATAQQMATLEDEPAYFRTRRKSQADKPVKPMTPIRLQKYLIDYTVLDPQLRAFAERTGRPATLEFAAVAYDADGLMLNGITNDAMAAAPTADGKSAVKFRVQQELEVPAGSAWIRVAVRDKITGHTGTLEVALPLKAAPAERAALTR